MDLEFETTGTRGGGRPVSVRVDVFYLPEYYAASNYAGRSDPGAPRRKVGSLSDTQDLEATVRKLATAPGAYYAASYAGRDLIDSNVFEIAPKGQRLDDTKQPATATATETATPQATATPGSDSSAHAINATTDTIRATKELIKEVTPPASAFGAEDVRRIVSETLAPVLERLQPPTAATQAEKPKSLAEQLKELAEAKGVMRELFAEPQPTGERDPVKVVVAQAEQFKQLRDVFGPSPIDNPDASTFDKLLSFGERAMRAAEQFAPVITKAMTAQAIATHMSAAPPQNAPPQQPTPTGQPQPASNPLIPLLRVLVDDCTSDANAARAADAINSLLSARPEFAPIVAQLFSTSSAELVETLAQMSGAHYLPKLPHSIRFCDELKAELRARAEQADEQGSDESEEDATAPPLQVNNDFSTEESVQAS